MHPADRRWPSPAPPPSSSPRCSFMLARSAVSRPPPARLAHAAASPWRGWLPGFQLQHRHSEPPVPLASYHQSPNRRRRSCRSDCLPSSSADWGLLGLPSRRGVKWRRPQHRRVRDSGARGRPVRRRESGTVFFQKTLKSDRN
jgi:hypothetical protein